MKYYNNCVFFNVQQGFIVQSGDPDNTGKGGSSVYGYMGTRGIGRVITILLAS